MIWTMGSFFFYYYYALMTEDIKMCTADAQVFFSDSDTLFDSTQAIVGLNSHKESNLRRVYFNLRNIS